MIHSRAAWGRVASLSIALALAGCGEVVSVSPDAARGLTDVGDTDGGSQPDTPDASVEGGDAGDDGGRDLACPAEQTCLGAVPSDWEGPAVLGENGSCPSSYPDVGDLIHRGLDAPAASCACGCVTTGIDCRLIASNEQGGGRFEPQSSCESPPVQNACLTVDAVGSCDTNASAEIAEATWTTTARVCTGAAAGASCEGGGCYPSPADDGPLCIVREGTHDCPEASGFSERTLYYRNFTDTRACSSCTCQATGQVCEKTLEICSVSFYQVTLSSDGDEECLNSGDGDGVTLMSQRVTDTGSCTTSGGSATGSASPTDPVTVCCTP